MSRRSAKRLYRQGWFFRQQQAGYAGPHRGKASRRGSPPRRGGGWVYLQAASDKEISAREKYLRVQLQILLSVDSSGGDSPVTCLLSVNPPPAPPRRGAAMRCLPAMRPCVLRYRHFSLLRPPSSSIQPATTHFPLLTRKSPCARPAGCSGAGRQWSSALRRRARG